MLAVLTERTETTRLADLAEGLEGLRVERGADVRVSRVRIDSRAVTPGDLFVAVPGQTHDGAQFIPEALSRGASGIVTPASGQAPPDGAWIVAEDPRLAAALLAARAWGDPSHRLDVLGVTGTNGKTTTSFLVRAIGLAAGRETAVLGTLGAILPRLEFAHARTTPEAPDLQEALAEAADHGAAMAVLEVSSHALDLKRVDGTRFAAAAFLNLTREHLDWHGTMESYADSKRRLFSDLLAGGRAPNGPRAVLNANDPWADRFRDVVEDALFFSVGGGDAEVTARGIQTNPNGTSFTLSTPSGEAPVALRLPGEHNVENALAAASLTHVMGIELDAIARGLSAAESPPGRFERVHRGTFDAFVDYAHTEDGVRRALEVARAAASGRVLVVLGCGGERDREKRPGMGRLAAELADEAIFTSDNPRSEDPAEIVEAMLEGAGEHRDRVTVVLDREEALGEAVSRARSGDLVLALGKGHESYQSIDGVDHPFPERQILSRLASERDSRAS